MSGSDGGNIVAIPKALLEPLKQLAALADRYGSVPRAIVGLISLYIVNGVLSIGSYIIGSFVALNDSVTASIRLAQNLLIGSLGAVGVDILYVGRSIQLQIATAIQGAGPLGPPIAVGIGALILYAMYRVVILALGELPLGSSLVDLLGLR